MVNKLWYEEDPEDGKWVREYLQELIDLYCFDSKLFKVPEDITLENLKEFLEIILRQYQYYNMHIGHLLDLGDAFDIYLDVAFRDEFEEGYANFPDSDRRGLALSISRRCLQHMTWTLFPEDVSFVIECLNAPDAEVVNMYDKLTKYFDQFDRINWTSKEEPKRWEAIKKERIEALQNNQPLPIRPMSIELDPCYKNSPKDDALN